MTGIDDDVAGPLADWLRAPLGAGAVHVSDLARAPAGQSSDTILFSASWSDGRGSRSRPLVLRRQRDGGLFLAPDVVREARILRGLEHASAVPVPRVLAWEEDPSVLGAPFFVMDRVAGRTPTAKPSIHATGWLTTLTADERARLWRSGMEALVAVHDIDWRSTHAFLDEDSSSSGLASHLDRLAEWCRWTTGGRSYPITDAAIDAVAVRRAAVDTGEPVLVWGDARPGNMIFGDDHRCAAVIDWEVATIGPAGIDLGHWLFFDELLTTGSGVERLPGWPDRDSTVACYQELSGRTLADLEFFELLEALFIAVTLIRQADLRVERGLAPPDTRMGHDNAVTRIIARHLGLPEPDLSPDYLAHRAG